MVTIDISIEDFSKLLGLKSRISTDALSDLLTFTKAEVDSEPEGSDENGHTKLTVEIRTSNRPDLYSIEGIAREARGMLNATGLPNLYFPKSNYHIKVDNRLKNIRPYIAAVIGKNLKFDDFLIKQFIQTQDKIDHAYGRKRKKVSIGIYNLSMIQSPINYQLVDRSFKFTPLQFEEEMTITEIFEKHPKGVEYRHILDPYKQVPILTSAMGVLSLPPIINSNTVGKITPETNDILIEVTGTNYEATIVTVSIFAQILADRDAEVETVLVEYPKSWNINLKNTPPSKPASIRILPKDINRYLGTRLSSQKMINLLKMRRHNAMIDGNEIIVNYGPWRNDILHWADISEEIAIAYGYNNLKPRIENISNSPGEVDFSTNSENLIRTIFVGCGLQEVLNYNLTDFKTIVTMVNTDKKQAVKQLVTIKNPMTKTFGYLRPNLLPGLLRFVSRNAEAQFPHKIFEVGEVVTRTRGHVKSSFSAAVLLAGTSQSFETSHQIIESLFKQIGLQYSLKRSTLALFIEGRSADVVISGKVVGKIGEIALEVLENFKIQVPVSGFELQLSLIPQLKIPSFYPDVVT